MRSTLAAFGICFVLNGTPLLAADDVPAATSGTLELIPYAAHEARYTVVGHGALEGFEQPAFDDTWFARGPMPFGTTNPGIDCALNVLDKIGTQWPLNSDLLVRLPFELPAQAYAVKVAVAFDDGVQVFVNGHDISGGMRSGSGCAALDTFVFQIRDEWLTPGENVLAVRGSDTGVLDYLDVHVTAQMP